MLFLLYSKLTIKDVTKEVISDVHYDWDSQEERIGIKAKMTINRFGYNINYDSTASDTGKNVNIIVH